MPVIFEKSTGRRITCEKEQKDLMLKNDKYVDDPNDCDEQPEEETPQDPAQEEETNQGPPGTDAANTGGDGGNEFLQD